VPAQPESDAAAAGDRWAAFERGLCPRNRSRTRPPRVTGGRSSSAGWARATGVGRGRQGDRWAVFERGLGPRNRSRTRPRA